MPEGIRRIYYDKSTGNVIKSYTLVGYFKEPSIEDDILAFSELSERNPDSFDVLQLNITDYSEDFAQCNGYRVNPETKQLEFSYPDPNEPEAPQVFRKPLSEEVEETKQAIAELTLLLAQMQMGGM